MPNFDAIALTVSGMYIDTKVLSQYTRWRKNKFLSFDAANQV